MGRKAEEEKGEKETNKKKESKIEGREKVYWPDFLIPFL